MLQDYRRRIEIKPFAPVFRDQSSKRWKSDLSVATDISLLSISDVSPIDQNASDRNRQSQQREVKHIDLNVDLIRRGAADDNEDFDPRAIRPPPFAQHIEQLRRPKGPGKPLPRRPTRIPVRTTRAEQLRLARQQSAPREPSTSRKPRVSPRDKTMISIRPPLRPSTASSDTLLRIESARSCRTALRSAKPLQFSIQLADQIEREMHDSRDARHSGPITQALLQKHCQAPLDAQYKMTRIRHWLARLVPGNCIELDESVSIASTLDTTVYGELNDDDEASLLSENVNGTYAEARRLLPILQSAIQQKKQHHTFVLTCAELDLYVM